MDDIIHLPGLFEFCDDVIQHEFFKYLLAVRLLLAPVPQVFSSVAFVVVGTDTLFGCATLTTHILTTVAAFHFLAKQVDHCVTVLSVFIAGHLGSDFGEDLRVHDGRINLVHHLVTVQVCSRILFVSEDAIHGVHRELPALIQNPMRRKRRDDFFDSNALCVIQDGLLCLVEVFNQNSIIELLFFLMKCCIL